MADQPVTREKLINADKDVQVIEDFIKKPKDETVTTRFGDEIMTLKGLEEEVQKSGGYFKRYTSLAAANADIANIPVDATIKVVSESDGGDYYKAGEAATSLSKSPHDPFEKSLKKINESSSIDSRFLQAVQGLAGTLADLITDNSSNHLILSKGINDNSQSIQKCFTAIQILVEAFSALQTDNNAIFDDVRGNIGL